MPGEVSHSLLKTGLNQYQSDSLTVPAAELNQISCPYIEPRCSRLHQTAVWNSWGEEVCVAAGQTGKGPSGLWVSCPGHWPPLLAKKLLSSSISAKCLCGRFLKPRFKDVNAPLLNCFCGCSPAMSREQVCRESRSKMTWLCVCKKKKKKKVTSDIHSLALVIYTTIAYPICWE